MSARCQFVIVRDSAQGSRPETLVAVRFPPGEERTIYDWAARPLYPLPFATQAQAQTYIDLMPKDERARCRVEQMP